MGRGHKCCSTFHNARDRPCSVPTPTPNKTLSSQKCQYCQGRETEINHLQINRGSSLPFLGTSKYICLSIQSTMLHIDLRVLFVFQESAFCTALHKILSFLFLYHVKRVLFQIWLLWLCFGHIYSCCLFLNNCFSTRV